MKNYRSISLFRKVFSTLYILAKSLKAINNKAPWPRNLIISWLMDKSEKFIQGSWFLKGFLWKDGCSQVPGMISLIRFTSELCFHSLKSFLAVCMGSVYKYRKYENMLQWWIEEVRSIFLMLWEPVFFISQFFIFDGLGKREDVNKNFFFKITYLISKGGIKKKLWLWPSWLVLWQPLYSTKCFH